MKTSTNVARFKELILSLADHARKPRTELDLAHLDKIQSDLLALGSTLSSDAMHCCSSIEDADVLIRSLGMLRRCTEILNDKLRCGFNPSDLGYFITRRLFFSSTESMSAPMQSAIRLYQYVSFTIRAVDDDRVLLASGCGKTRWSSLKDLIVITPS